MKEAGEGTTMSPGVTTPVSGHAAGVEAQGLATVNLIDSPISTEEAPLGAAETGFKLPEAVKIENISISQSLIFIAKEEGVDAALERLANGEIDKKENTDTVTKQPEPETGSEVKEKEGEKGQLNFKDATLEYGEKTDADSLPSSEKVLPFHRELLEIHKTASRIIEKADDQEFMQSNQRLAWATVYEMARIINKLLDEQENGKKKEDMGVVAALVKLMAKLMEAMFVPKEDDGILDGQSEQDRKLEKLAA